MVVRIISPNWAPAAEWFREQGWHVFVKREHGQDIVEARKWTA